jgi:hypothetical protein
MTLRPCISRAPTVESPGTVYVIDSGNNRVVKLTVR